MRASPKLTAALLAMAPLVGCGQRPAPESTTTVTVQYAPAAEATAAAGSLSERADRPTVAAVPPAATPPDVQETSNPGIVVTQRAKDEIARLSQNSTYKLRLWFTTDGCTGFTKKLDLDPDPPAANDSTYDCGGLICVYSTEHFALVQGALVDFYSGPDKRGFDVTFPTKTARNHSLTSAWIAADVAKRAAAAAAPVADRIAETQALLTKEPENEQVHYRLARLYLEAKRPADAVKSAGRAVELSPNMFIAYMVYGEALLRTNDLNEARKVLRKGKLLAELADQKAAVDEFDKLLAEAK